MKGPSRARVFRAPARPPARQHVLQTRGTSHGARKCGTCDLTVPVRKDGTLGAHRVGTSRHNSWPCPGVGT